MGKLQFQRFPGGSAQFAHQLEAYGNGEVVHLVDGLHVVQRGRIAEQHVRWSAARQHRHGDAVMQVQLQQQYAQGAADRGRMTHLSAQQAEIGKRSASADQQREMFAAGQLHAGREQPVGSAVVDEVLGVGKHVHADPGPGQGPPRRHAILGQQCGQRHQRADAHGTVMAPVRRKGARRLEAHRASARACGGQAIADHATGHRVRWPRRCRICKVVAR